MYVPSLSLYLGLATRQLFSKVLEGFKKQTQLAQYVKKTLQKYNSPHIRAVTNRPAEFKEVPFRSGGTPISLLITH